MKESPAPKSEEIEMMLLVISAILASLAMGVTIAYGLCCALFAFLRFQVATQGAAHLPMRPESARL